MNTFRDIIGTISILFLVSSCVPIPVDQPKPRVFKDPLFDVVYKDIPIVDMQRDKLLDRIDSLKDKITPDDRVYLYILRDTEYAVYLAYNVSVAGGDESAVKHYRKKLTDIYVAMNLILNRYAIPVKSKKSGVMF